MAVMQTNFSVEFPEIICFKCHKYTHLDRDCPENKSQKTWMGYKKLKIYGGGRIGYDGMKNNQNSVSEYDYGPVSVNRSSGQIGTREVISGNGFESDSTFRFDSGKSRRGCAYGDRRGGSTSRGKTDNGYRARWNDSTPNRYDNNGIKTNRGRGNTQNGHYYKKNEEVKYIPSRSGERSGAILSSKYVVGIRNPISHYETVPSVSSPIKEELPKASTNISNLAVNSSSSSTPLPLSLICPFKKDSYTKVIVSYVTSKYRMHVRLVDELSVFYQILLSTNKGTEKFEFAKPVLGNLYVVRDDEGWWRGICKSVKPPRFYFIDFGNEKECNDYVKIMPDWIGKIPPMAYEVMPTSLNCHDFEDGEELSIKLSENSNISHGPYNVYIEGFPEQDEDATNKQTTDSAQSTTIPRESQKDLDLMRVAVNKRCIALFENEWYRGVIVNVEPIRVFLEDSGDIAIFEQENIKMFPSEFESNDECLVKVDEWIKACPTPNILAKKMSEEDLAKFVDNSVKKIAIESPTTADKGAAKNYEILEAKLEKQE